MMMSEKRLDRLSRCWLNRDHLLRTVVKVQRSAWSSSARTTVSLSSQITLMWKINPVRSVQNARAIGSSVALKRLCWGNSFSVLEFFFPLSQTPLTEREDQSCLPRLLILLPQPQRLGLEVLFVE